MIVFVAVEFEIVNSYIVHNIGLFMEFANKYQFSDDSQFYDIVFI
jgi:hypothetical protein